MATKTADDSVGPIGFLIFFLIAAMAIGGAMNGGLDLPEGGGGGAFKDPCEGKDRDHVVASFEFGRYTLRCGHKKEFGWRHIDKRHPVGRKTTDCIKAVLDNAPLKPDKGALIATWAFRPGDFARVVINPGTNNIKTAYTEGKPNTPESARWDDCVKGAGR